MIIICEAKATEAQIHAVQQKIHEAGLVVHRSDGVEHTVLGVVGDRNRLDTGAVSMMPGVRDLVVILEIAEEAAPAEISRCATVRAAAEAGVAAVVDEHVGEGFGEIGESAEVGIVSAAFTGENGVERVMKIVGPLCVDSVAAGFARGDDAGVVEVAFGDQEEMAAELRFEPAHFFRELFEEMGGGRIVDGVYRVEAQAGEMIIAEPHQRVVTKEAADFVAIGVVEIDGGSPGCGVGFREIRAEPREVISDGAEVVIDDVE